MKAALINQGRNALPHSQSAVVMLPPDALLSAHFLGQRFAPAYFIDFFLPGHIHPPLAWLSRGSIMKRLQN
jgi:hypothetical protein